MRFRMLVETFGQKNNGADGHRRSPELAQELAVDLQVLNVFGVFRLRHRSDRLRQRNLDASVLGGINVDLLWLAVKIPGLLVPLLTLASLRRQLDGMAIGQMIGLVDVQQGLHVVITRGNATEAQRGISNRSLIDNRRFAGSEAVHVDSEKLLRIGFVSDLKTRLLIAVGRQQDVEAPVQRLLVLLRCKRDFEAKFRAGAIRRFGGLGDSNYYEEHRNDSKNQQKPTHSFVSSRREPPKPAYMATLKPSSTSVTLRSWDSASIFVDNHKSWAKTSRNAGS